MTDQTKTTCSAFLKWLLVAVASSALTIFVMGISIGEERGIFQAAAERSIQNQADIRKIQLQIAEDRIISRHMLDLLNEVRADVRAIRERNER